MKADTFWLLLGLLPIARLRGQGTAGRWFPILPAAVGAAGLHNQHIEEQDGYVQRH